MKKLLILIILLIFCISLVSCSEEAKLEEAKKEFFNKLLIDIDFYNIIDEMGIDAYQIKEWGVGNLSDNIDPDGWQNLENLGTMPFAKIVILTEGKQLEFTAFYLDDEWLILDVSKADDSAKVYWMSEGTRDYFDIYDWRTDKLKSKKTKDSSDFEEAEQRRQEEFDKELERIFDKYVE